MEELTQAQADMVNAEKLFEAIKTKAAFNYDTYAYLGEAVKKGQDFKSLPSGVKMSLLKIVVNYAPVYPPPGAKLPEPKAEAKQTVPDSEAEVIPPDGRQE